MSFGSKLSLGGIGRNFPELKKLWNNQKHLHTERFAMKKIQKLSVAVIQIEMSIVPFARRPMNLGAIYGITVISTSGHSLASNKVISQCFRQVLSFATDSERQNNRPINYYRTIMK